MFENFDEKLLGEFKSARMMKMNLVDAVEKEQKSGRFAAARLRRGGSVAAGGGGGGSGERTAAMALAEGMTECDPLASDQRLKTPQRPRIGIQQNLSQRRHLRKTPDE